MGCQGNLTSRAPLVGQTGGALRAGGDESGLAQDSATQPSERGGQLAIDVLGALYAEGNAMFGERPPPLRRGQREGLRLDECHVRTQSGAQRSACSEVEVPLLTAGEGHGQRVQRTLHALERLRSDEA